MEFDVEETVETLTLAEFLSARIAEDRQAAEDVVVAWATQPHGGATHDPGLPSPARVLAECEAKRRIMELARVLAGRDNRHDEVMREVMLELAQPYADHPDFRDEWRL